MQLPLFLQIMSHPLKVQSPSVKRSCVCLCDYSPPPLVSTLMSYRAPLAGLLTAAAVTYVYWEGLVYHYFYIFYNTKWLESRHAAGSNKICLESRQPVHEEWLKGTGSRLTFDPDMTACFSSPTILRLWLNPEFLFVLGRDLAPSRT